MKKHLKSWLEAAAKAALIFALLYLVFFPVKVDGPSMERTFCDGDRIIVSRILAYMDMYDKGDIVVFKHDINGRQVEMIKRVIAVEGDRIEIKGGNVYVNGLKLEEEYINQDTAGDIDAVVEDGCIFVMGDNRGSSVDSRSIGFVEKDDVTAKVVMKFYPFDSVELY